MSCKRKRENNRHFIKAQDKSKEIYILNQLSDSNSEEQKLIACTSISLFCNSNQLQSISSEDELYEFIPLKVIEKLLIMLKNTHVLDEKTFPLTLEISNALKSLVFTGEPGYILEMYHHLDDFMRHILRLCKSFISEKKAIKIEEFWFWEISFIFYDLLSFYIDDRHLFETFQCKDILKKMIENHVLSFFLDDIFSCATVLLDDITESSIIENDVPIYDIFNLCTFYDTSQFKIILLVEHVLWILAEVKKNELFYLLEKEDLKKSSMMNLKKAHNKFPILQLMRLVLIFYFDDSENDNNIVKDILKICLGILLNPVCYSILNDLIQHPDSRQSRFKQFKYHSGKRAFIIYILLKLTQTVLNVKQDKEEIGGSFEEEKKTDENDMLEITENNLRALNILDDSSPDQRLTNTHKSSISSYYKDSQVYTTISEILEALSGLFNIQMANSEGFQISNEDEDDDWKIAIQCFLDSLNDVSIVMNNMLNDLVSNQINFSELSRKIFYNMSNTLKNGHSWLVYKASNEYILSKDSFNAILNSHLKVIYTCITIHSQLVMSFFELFDNLESFMTFLLSKLQRALWSNALCETVLNIFTSLAQSSMAYTDFQTNTQLLTVISGFIVLNNETSMDVSQLEISLVAIDKLFDIFGSDEAIPIIKKYSDFTFILSNYESQLTLKILQIKKLLKGGNTIANIEKDEIIDIYEKAQITKINLKRFIEYIKNT